MGDCFFCKIAKEIATDLIYENKNIVAFRDINPQAPVHILLIPKLHFSTLNDLLSNDKYLAGSLIYNAAKLAKREGIAEQGYRTVFNCNEWGADSISYSFTFVGWSKIWMATWLRYCRYILCL